MGFLSFLTEHNTIQDTLKFLLKDINKLSEQLRKLKADYHILNNDLTNFEERLSKVEETQPIAGSVPVGISLQSLEEAEHLLDLPLARILELYREIPQILEPICRRGALSNSNNLILERHGQGNYWVLQLREQGFFLLPRPGAFVRLATLESLEKLFELKGEPPESGTYEFVLKKPATLTLLRRNQRWQLLEKGLIEFGQSPLEFQWQQEIRTMREQYQQFTSLLERVGEAGLDAALKTQRWQEQLEQRYGKPISIIINTSMPIAYGIYKGPILVPYQVIMGGNSVVVPAWDRGIPWETSFEVLRSDPEHPILPNQPYIKGIHLDGTHTWAVANDYQEASRILSRLNSKWGLLWSATEAKSQNAGKFSLHLQNQVIPLSNGTCLTITEIQGLKSFASDGIVAKVEPNPQEPGVLGLKNCSLETWRATLASGKEIKVELWRSLKLATGTKIDFGSVRGEIY